jgi:hypothetical protein
MFAVVCDLEPVKELAITSVQMVKEKVVPLNDLKLRWVPYVLPTDNPAFASQRVFLLGCKQRRVSTKVLDQDKVNDYTYAIPYIYNPFKQSADDEDTECSIPVMIDGFLKPYSHDWKYDDPKVFNLLS